MQSFIQHPAVKVTSICRGNYWGSLEWISMHIFCIHQKKKKKWEYKEVVHQLLIDFKKAYYSVRREVFIQFGIPMKLVSQSNLQQSQGRQTFVWHVSY
jgi:hypothetical protein